MPDQKTLFMFWDRGWHKVPELVQKCKDSWILMNPDYEIVLLDNNNVLDYAHLPGHLDLTRPDIPVQKFSNLVRLALLTEYGGVWADATTYCLNPLANWLECQMPTGFFAFAFPGKDRLLSSWFLAAEPNNYLITALSVKHLNFFHCNRFTRLNTRVGRRTIETYSKRWNQDYHSTRKWTSFYAQKVLKVYPHFILHYLFNELILTNHECQRIWEGSNLLPAHPSHRLQTIARSSGDRIAKMKNCLSAEESPVYKLNWRADLTDHYW